MRSSLVCASLLALGSLGTARSAWASDNYPNQVAKIWVLKKTPECTLCHLSLLGGAGSVKTKFGKNVHEKFGAKGSQDVSSLYRALLAEDAHTTDSDGDGVGDHQELYEGTDPNVSDRTAPKPPPAQHDDHGGEGGAGSSEFPALGGQPSQPAVWTPPTAAPTALPPALEHGCATSPSDRGTSHGAALLALAFFASARRHARSRRGL